MNDFEGLLSSEYGFKPQGKSAPMSSSKPPPSSNRSASASLNFDLGSRNSSSFSDSIFTSKPAPESRTLDDLEDIFGAPARGVEKSKSARADSSFDFDSMFNSTSKSSSSAPVYDKPVYDDDIFEGLPGMKASSSSGVKYDDVFESMSSTSPPSRTAASGGFDDLLGGFGNRESQQPKSKKEDPAMPAFDDLIPGFGGSSRAERSIPKSTWSSEPTATSSKTMEDPFAAPRSASPPAVSSSGVSLDPLEEFSTFGKSGSTKADAPSVPSGAVFDDLDPFDGLGKSIPPTSPDNNIKGRDRNPSMTEHSKSDSQRYNDREQSDKISQKTVPVAVDLESHQNIFDMSSPTGSFSASVHSHERSNSNDANIPADIPPGYEVNIETSDEVWLTVSEIPLFTQPTRAPPPSRPPPPRPARAPKAGSGSFGSTSIKMGNEFSPSANSNQHFEGANSVPSSRTTTVDELEDFAMGRSNGNNIDNHVHWASGEEMNMNSDAAAAAMKEAMDRAEAKFRHAKEVRGRENIKAARSRESVQKEKDENWLDVEEIALREEQERLQQERLQREREEKERERRRLEQEREREEKEKEQQRLEKERERVRQIERERARQAVDRANREARERAAAEARRKAERVAVGKANAEARERAERAAVLRAQAEARERAAADARERAERAAADARERAERAAAEAREREERERAAEARARAEKAEKAAAEAREKEARERAAEARRRAERAAVERAAAEARERAGAEARERTAASARAKQQSNDGDLESFFSMGRASSVPRPRTNYSDPAFDTQFPSKKVPEVARTSDSTPSMRKASSSANIVDDLSSIFGGVSTSGEFQEVEGESEERRRARLERHQRTQERAAKAVAEKNQRDLQAQREQAERHRFAESLDAEIKRWAAGKEGNLRALLSTLQYVLWPECGWQPVSLTDLITAAAVKKVYRKATLFIHPDKVQQKGANLQQKYVAEKVFDLLKEAWNKFNSEELF